MPNLSTIDVLIGGRVQGVGFRPFVYTLAKQLKLRGWVRNNHVGVQIRAAGPDRNLKLFLRRITDERPAVSKIESILCVPSSSIALKTFTIRKSLDREAKVEIPPDLAPCRACELELRSPNERRYAYPFISCAHCGPRFTIHKEATFDRSNTAMKAFPMCPECLMEYEDPGDRRFHAQTLCCPACGPSLRATDKFGKIIADAAIQIVAKELQRGKVAAIKGIGGYQLAVNSLSQDGINKLRERKRRPEKPFAVMVSDIAAAKELCHLSPVEMRYLSSQSRPIVVARTRSGTAIPQAVNPGLATLAVMLPSSPLHILLLDALKTPLIVTSGNISSHPILTCEKDAYADLADTADIFLTHDRAIYHRADDPILRVIADEPTLIRNGRGYAPLYFDMKGSGQDLMALGGQLKNSFALHTDKKLVLSQHIGDLSTRPTRSFLRDEISSYKSISRSKPTKIICDSHPDYMPTRLAALSEQPKAKVQHHVAHVMSCLVENNYQGIGLGISWDGVGWGADGMAWGGEFFRVDTEAKTIKRVASFLPFPLLGGDKAAREPRRLALATAWMCSTVGRHQAKRWPYVQSFSDFELNTLLAELRRPNRQQILSTSVGRLFDAVSSFLDLAHICSYEAQSASHLEGVAGNLSKTSGYTISTIEREGVLYFDWRPMFKDIFSDIENSISKAQIAARFHKTLINTVIHCLEHQSLSTALISGGVFQNRLLTEGLINEFKTNNLQVLRNNFVPTNDAGLAAGQLIFELFGMRELSCV